MLEEPHKSSYLRNYKKFPRYEGIGVPVAMYWINKFKYLSVFYTCASADKYKLEPIVTVYWQSFVFNK